MRFYMTVRKLCRVASVQLKTAQTANLVKKSLSQNPGAFEMFNKVVETPEIKLLDSIFRTNGYELRMAGGPVRDILCGIRPKDLDFATNATPDQMIEMMRFYLIDLEAFHRGTVTAIINAKQHFEISTSRLDKTTDGRHPSEVEFVNDWKIDSSSRDLTINSMFLDLNGVLYDYFNGETDLKNKVIRFVGDPESRIREDYIRIFRYFRFHARFGCAQKHDLNTLKAIKDNLNVLSKISGETIWTEISKILVLHNCLDVIKVMVNDIQIGKYMGFRPNERSVKEDQNVIHTSEDDFTRDLSQFQKVLSTLVCGVQSGVMPNWEASTLFASLISDSGEFEKVAKRLHLPSVRRHSIRYIINNRQNLLNSSLSDLRKQLALSPEPNQEQLRKAIIECMKYCGRFHEISSIAEWTIPSFPYVGLAPLIGGKVKKTQLIKGIIDELKMFWVNSDFQCTEDDLKVQLERILLRDKYQLV